MKPTPAAVDFSRIVQVALVVSDVKRSIAFYRDVLGMKFLFEVPNMAFFDCGGIRLLLGLAGKPDQKSTGSVVYFKVDDIQAAYALLRERGAPFTGEPHFLAPMADHDLWLALFQDPDGNHIGLMSEVRK
ncbi:MAG TPA: VOC family protein [Verrucomicrobiae bacterium]|nr:VOC family protein [Verrucomicrobiae bacterium]